MLFLPLFLTSCKSLTFDISKVKGLEPTMMYKGPGANKFTITITVEKILKEDTDYTVSYENNEGVTKGETKATVTITGAGDYEGSTVTHQFSITPGVQTPEITTTENTVKVTGLKEDAQPTVTYYSAENDESSMGTKLPPRTGKYFVKVTAPATANYQEYTSDFTAFSYKGSPKKFTEGDVTGLVASIEYQGSAEANVLDISITANKLLLIENTDYTVSYTGNEDVTTGEAKATVTITGINDFSGSTKIEHKFAITKATQDPTITTTNNKVEVTDVKENAKVTIKYYSAKDDQTLLKGPPAESGTYYVKISITETTHYKAFTSDTFTKFDYVTPKTFAEKDVTGIPKELTMTYQGSAELNEFPIVIKVGDETLVKDTHYTVEYTGNDQVTEGATATVTITGKGEYSTSKVIEKKFAITQAKQNPTVSADKNKVLVSGIKELGVLTIKYFDSEKAPIQSKPTETGSYFVKISIAATTNYKAYDSPDFIAFNYTKSTKAFTKENVKGLEKLTIDYKGSAALNVLPINITVETTVLTEDTDYIVEYTGNEQVTDAATVKIIGIGAYASSADIEKTFTITQADQNPTVSADKNKVLVSGIKESGVLTIKYFKSDKQTEIEKPTETGKYFVKISIAATTNYKAYESPDFIAFTYTQSTKAFTKENVKGLEKLTIVYQGSAALNVLPINITVETKVLTKDTDYIVEYTGNEQVTDAATVKIIGINTYASSADIESKFSITKATQEPKVEITEKGEVNVTSIKEEGKLIISYFTDSEGKKALETAPLSEGTYYYQITISATTNYLEYKSQITKYTISGSEESSSVEDDGSLSPGAIAGISIGVIVAVAAIAFCVYWFVLRKPKAVAAE